MRRRIAFGAVVALVFAAAIAVIVLRPVGPRQFPADEPAGARLDDDGDPLPPGAVARLGSARFRTGACDALGLAYSRDGTEIRSPFAFGRVAWFDAKTGRRERVVRGHRRWLIREGTDLTLAQHIDVLLGRSPAPRPPWSLDELQRVLSIPGTDDFLTIGSDVLYWTAAGDARVVCPVALAVSGVSGAVSPDGTTLALLSSGELSVIGLKDGQHRRPAALLHHDCRHVAFTPDGARLVVLASDRSDSGPGALLVTPVAPDADAAAHTLAPVDPESCMCVMRDDTVWIGSADAGVLVRSLADGALVRRVAAPGRSVEAIVRSDGGVAAVLFRGEQQSDTVEFHELATGALRAAFTLDSGRVRDLVLSPDGTELALRDTDGVIQRVDVASGSCLTPERAASFSPSALAVSEDGHRLASYGRDRLRIWDLDTARPGAAHTVSTPFTRGVSSMSFLRDGTRLRLLGGGAHGYEADWCDVDVTNGDAVATGSLVAPKAELTATHDFRFGPLADSGERTLLSAQRNTHKQRDVKGLRDIAWVLETTTGRVLHTETPVSEAALSPDGRRLAWQYGDVLVRDVDSDAAPECVSSLLFYPRLRLADALCVSPDGARVAVLDVPRSDAPRHLAVMDCRSGSVAFAHAIELPWPYWMRNLLVWSPDGSMVVTLDREGAGGVRLWNAASGKLLARTDGQLGPVLDAVFTPDGRRLITAGGDTTGLVFDVAELLELGAH